ncbi:MAG: hypothetical protein ACYDEE_11020 [Ignavibacteriaceae bacterium]
MTTSLSQINIQKLSSNLLRVIVRQNNFIVGEIDTTRRTFYSVPRSIKNLFHLFHGDEGGLGLNEEIFHLDSFDTIKMKFNDKILTTTRLKWLAKGVTSPYCDTSVDKQIILRLSDINMLDADKYEPAQILQEELFPELV